MDQIIEQVKFKIVSCCVCGVLFGIDNALQSRRLDDGKLFYCPNGHEQHYGKHDDQEREIKRLRNSLEAKRQEAEFRYHQLNGMKGQLAKTKKELTRTKTRVANGVCPCCNRQFVNLQKHMSGQHPEFKEQAQP